MFTFTITIGTTPVNLWLLLTNQATYANASVQGSRKMGTPNAPLCNELILLADDANTQTVYGGSINTVSSSDYGFRIDASMEHRMIGNGVPTVPLTQWLVAGGNGQKVHVKISW